MDSHAWLCVVLVLLSGCSASPSTATEPEHRPEFELGLEPKLQLERSRTALARSLPLLQGSMDTWIEEVSCISCHHQGLGTLAVVMAKERGLAVDEELHARQVERMLALTPGGSLHGDAGVNGTFGRSFQLVALAAADVARDERTDAMAHFLAGNAVREVGPGERGSWRSTSYRPPLEASQATGTAIALRALDLYRPDTRARDAEAAIARARRWLEALEPGDAEERAMRLFGLAWAGSTQAHLAAAADDILNAQREDGGWAQLETMESDAYATGQALVALQQMAGMAPDDPAFRRGLHFLLETQLEDGSWRVETRRRAPGLPYFESGFPHGMHQFISTAATAWACMALCCALDPAPSAALRGPRPARSATPAELGLQPLHLAAAFGSLAQLFERLDAGADPNAAGAGGLTPLHLAVHDATRIELLLEHGAEVDARTEYGATPLILAAWYDAPDTWAVQQLLAAGADPNARTQDGMTPLLRAVRSNKLELVPLLLSAGAELDARDAEGSSALHWATTSGLVEMAELLITAGLDPDVRGAEGVTPLLWASYDGKDELVRSLLERGADPDSSDDLGLTPLGMAARVEHGNDRSLTALLAAGADPSALTLGGRTPLEWARHFDNKLAIAALEAQLEPNAAGQR